MLYQFSGKFRCLEIPFGILWGLIFWSRDFLRFLFFPPFDHPRHLKSEVLPLGQGAPSAGIVVGYCKNNSALILHPKLYLQ